MARARELLIFEPASEGHSQEWLQHLIDFVLDREDAPSIEVLAPPALCAALSRSVPPSASGRVGFVPMTAAEMRLCSHRSQSLAAFARWWTMRRHLRRSGADAGFFMCIDILSLPLAFGLGGAGKPLSGILFRPSVHYGAIGHYRPTLPERLRDLRKNVLYRLMLRNPAVGAVLSLDPYFPAYALSHYQHGEKVQALPDPAHPAITSAQEPQAAAAFASSTRTRFILFGHLTARKGPLIVLDALKLLPPAVAARVAVLFAGRVDGEIREAFEGRRRAVNSAHPQLWLGLEDRRLEAAELDALVMKSDVVMAPYQRFVGSSGVLLWAARAGRPVLAQEYGLVGRLTREHGLGVVADSSDPAKLAAEIARMVEKGPETFIDRASAERFAQSRTPHLFSSLVMRCRDTGAQPDHGAVCSRASP